MGKAAVKMPAPPKASTTRTTKPHDYVGCSRGTHVQESVYEKAKQTKFAIINE